MNTEELASQATGTAFKVLAVGRQSKYSDLLSKENSEDAFSLQVDFATKTQATRVLHRGKTGYKVLLVDQTPRGLGVGEVIQAGRAGGVPHILVVGDARQKTDQLRAILYGADGYLTKIDYLWQLARRTRRSSSPQLYLQGKLRNSLDHFAVDLAANVYSGLSSLLTGGDTPPGNLTTGIRRAVEDLSPRKLGLTSRASPRAYEERRDDVTRAIEFAVDETLRRSTVPSRPRVRSGSSLTARSPAPLPTRYPEVASGEVHGQQQTQPEPEPSASPERFRPEVMAEIRPEVMPEVGREREGGGSGKGGGGNGGGGDTLRGRAKGARNSSLFWNRYFPEDPGILRNDPHVVAAGGRYRFETALETQSRKTGTHTEVASEDVVGHDVVFALSATNGHFRVDGSDKWRSNIESSKFACAAAGTERFGVTYRAGTGGTATIETSLIILNGTVLTDRIDLFVAGPGSSVVRTPATSMASNVPKGVGRRAEQTSLRLQFDVHNQEAWLNIDGDELPGRGRPPTADSISVLYDDAYVKLRKLSNATSYQPTGEGFEIEDPGGARLALAQIGARLHEALFLHPIGTAAFDPNMQQIADAISEQPAGQGPPLLEIAAKGYPVPWGLLYDRSKSGGKDLKSPEDVEDEGFWGRRFDIRRVLVRKPPWGSPWRGRRRRVKPVVAQNAPGGATNAEYVRRLRKMRDGDGQLKIASTITTPTEMLDWAGKNNDTDLLYLFCHALPARSTDDTGGPTTVMDPLEGSILGLGTTDHSIETVRLADLLGKWYKPRRTFPIVFLNACSSGHLDVTYGAPFADFFLDRWRAQAFVGTDWPVSGAFADRFGRRFLDALLNEEKTLQEAMRLVAEESFRAGNLFPVLYGLYGPGNVRFAEESA